MAEQPYPWRRVHAPLPATRLAARVTQGSLLRLVASIKARPGRPGSPAPFARAPHDTAGDRPARGRGRSAGRSWGSWHIQSLPALQRRAFDTYSPTFSKAGQRTVTFDLRLPEAKRPSLSSHVSGMPRAAATQQSPRARSMARNRHFCQRIACLRGAKAALPGRHRAICIGVSPADEQSLI